VLIKNNIIGVLVDSIGSNSVPTLAVSNTEIYNTTNFGILGRETKLMEKILSLPIMGNLLWHVQLG